MFVHHVLQEVPGTRYRKEGNRATRGSSLFRFHHLKVSD